MSAMSDMIKKLSVGSAPEIRPSLNVAPSVVAAPASAEEVPAEEEPAALQPATRAAVPEAELTALGDDDEEEAVCWTKFVSILFKTMFFFN